jgi:hypothetical protein
VGGQKLRASEVLMLQEKLKQKKFQRWRFLDFVFSLLRRFSQSKFHFDFEDDSKKVPGYFFLLANVSSFSSKKIHDWDCFASLMIPFLAKNSRLGYFFNANNLTQTRLQIQSPDLRLEALFVRH